MLRRIVISVSAAIAIVTLLPLRLALGQGLARRRGAALDSARGIPAIRDVDTSYHLSGDGVMRMPPDPNFIDRARVLIHGEHRGLGCRFHSDGLSPYNAERDVEIDQTNCLAIRSRGEFRVPRLFMPQESYSIIIPFRAHFGPLSPRSDTTRRDSTRRKPRPNDPIPMR